MIMTQCRHVLNKILEDISSCPKGSALPYAAIIFECRSGLPHSSRLRRYHPEAAGGLGS